MRSSSVAAFAPLSQRWARGCALPAGRGAVGKDADEFAEEIVAIRTAQDDDADRLSVGADEATALDDDVGVGVGAVAEGVVVRAGAIAAAIAVEFDAIVVEGAAGQGVVAGDADAVAQEGVAVGVV